MITPDAIAPSATRTRAKQVAAIPEEKIEALLKDDPKVLALWREEMKMPTRTEGDCDNNVIAIGKATKQGNSRSYTLSRLEKQYPGLFERVVAGELSANAEDSREDLQDA